MRIKGGPIDPKALTSRHRGIVIRDTWQGPVVQARPRPGAMRGQLINQQYRTRFGFAARMAANPEPLQMATAIEMAKGTEQVPRDILTMAALGRYYVIVNPDGTEWGHVEGPIVTPAPEQEETMWQWSLWDLAASASSEVSGHATKGSRFFCEGNYDVLGTRMLMQGNIGETYNMWMFELGGGGVITAAQDLGPFLPYKTGNNIFTSRVPYSLALGSTYVLAMTRTDGTGTSVLGMRTASPARWLIPMTEQRTIFINTTAPVVGDTATSLQVGHTQPWSLLLSNEE